MKCYSCELLIPYCQCPDIDERLKKVAQDPSMSLFWCKQCDKHYQRCKCEKPVVILSHTLIDKK